MLVGGVLPSLGEGTIVEGVGQSDDAELAILRKGRNEFGQCQHQVFPALVSMLEGEKGSI